MRADASYDMTTGSRPLHLFVLGDGLTSTEQAHECLAHIQEDATELGAIVHISGISGRAIESSVLLAQTITQPCDVLLIPASSISTPGALREMLAVAQLDPRIAFVAPRTLGDGPDALLQESVIPCPYRHNSDYIRIASRLTRFTYAPFVIPAALWISGAILAEFGSTLALTTTLEDCVTLILRANRCGYRLAIANRAFISRAVSPKKLIELTQQLAIDFPEASDLLLRHQRSAEHRATRLIAELASDVWRITFDLSHLTPRHNGTSEAALHIVAAAAATWPENISLYISVSESAWCFHKLSELPRIQRADPDDDAPSAAVIRIGQPYTRADLQRTFTRSPVVTVFMLDTISYDCGYLSLEFDPAVWRFTCEMADIVIGNSEYTMHCLHNRFSFGSGVTPIVSYHSLNTAEYLGSTPHAGEGDSILIVGNSYAHKFVTETVDAMARAGLRQRIIAIGYPSYKTPPSGVEACDSGNMNIDTLGRIYASAKVVVYPSHYEGFGFPILNALARQRPVFVRDTAHNRDLAGRIPEGCNIHFYTTTRELLEHLANPPTWSESRLPVEHHDWDTSALQIWDALEAALRSANAGRIANRLHQYEAITPSPNELIPLMNKEQIAALRLTPVFKHLLRWPIVKRLIGAIQQFRRLSVQ